MAITTRSEYGLRALVVLAEQLDDELTSVAPSKFDRVHAEPYRCDVERSLSSVVRFGLTSPAVRTDRRRVGEHAFALPPELRCAIEARGLASDRHQ